MSSVKLAFRHPTLTTSGRTGLVPKHAVEMSSLNSVFAPVVSERLAAFAAILCCREIEQGAWWSSHCCNCSDQYARSSLRGGN